MRPGRDARQPALAAAAVTLVAGGARLPRPQIPAIAAGFAIIWALAWRRQDAAVAAIEERDGVDVLRRAHLADAPDPLVRTPGFRREVPGRTDGAVT